MDIIVHVKIETAVYIESIQDIKFLKLVIFCGTTYLVATTSGGSY